MCGASQHQRAIKKRSWFQLQIWHFTVTLIVAVSCHGQRITKASESVDANHVSNLRAFAKLYGVVRWFHPSDAAAVINWDRFAVDGVHRTIDAPDSASLRNRLQTLFGPMAPTMHIAREDEISPDSLRSHSKSTGALDLVAWQHKGYGDSIIATGYACKRLHRDRVVAVRGSHFAALSQTLDATPLRGRRVRLRGKLRTLHHARGQLWLRVDRADSIGFFDNMAQHPVSSETWTTAEIIGEVAEDATRIVFGELMVAAGPAAKVWYDDLGLSVEMPDGAWKQISIQNGGFEDSDLFASWHPGVAHSSTSKTPAGWNVAIDYDKPASGRASLRIEPLTQTVNEELFPHVPEPGETVEVDLGSGLRAMVPIALYSKDGRTVGDDPKSAILSQSKGGISAGTTFDSAVGVADVIVFWNVFKHFWPYWDTISTDWNSALDVALTEELHNSSIDGHVAALERFSAAVPDGHIDIRCPGITERAYLPFAVDLVESQVVVTASGNPLVKRGDVIITVDERPAQQLLMAEKERISGSPQWRTVVAVQRFGRGAHTSSARLRIRRGEADIDVAVTRVKENVSEGPTRLAIEHFADGNYYIDMARAGMDDISAIIASLSTAPGVILDFRHYPKLNHQLLSHIITQTDTPKGWELIPLITHPDTPSKPEAWEDTSTWNMPILTARQPHIAGRVAVLTGPEAISYAESVMALVAHYHLGEIFGAPTAGTNGDIAQIDLPSGCSTLFTGRRVLNPDGSRFHLIGIQPTVPVSRTIAGVVAGRDEVLERALAYVRTGVK